MHQEYIPQQVSQALNEDLNNQNAMEGDITAQLIPESQQAFARVITRQFAVICGVEWVNETIKQVDSTIEIQWSVKDGDRVQANDVLFTLAGPARAILTAERTCLNFLQMLSATATQTAVYVDKLKEIGSTTKILDTRKTIPGLRFAQKYAVTCGGGQNHRIGLFDAYLIKENHIQAAGGIAQAISKAHELNPGKTVEVEVETMDELQQAIDAGADIVMLDNFTVAQTQAAIELAKGKVKLEASGNMDQDKYKSYAELNIDFISIGGLTKHVDAIDLSMRFVQN
ncbi:MAG: carboxylating nicotinate-nucleotide diphosphorylase [Gammaproteobacteria bacterium]|nr:carboxylating nicotinate-nucleotide diphosphorylase [Gammaproteobacteria bacterium]